jgi:hypothetical protein
VSVEIGGAWTLLCGVANALGLPFARRRRSLADSNRKHMSTTALDVDSRECAPASEPGALDLARDPHLGQEKPTATSTHWR